MEKTGTIPTTAGAEGQLGLGFSAPLRASNAGLFLSRGVGIHPDRVIGSYEIIFVRDGSLHLQEEGRAFRLARGQSLLLFPGRRHLGLSPYPAQLAFYWLHFTLRPTPDDPAPLQVPQHATVARPDHLASLFHRFLDDQERGDLRPLEADLLTMQMLLEIARSEAAGGAGSGAGARLAGRAEVMIRQRFHQDLSASSLAQALSCNPDYLGRVFRQRYGHTLTEALLRMRVRHARQLLLDSAFGMEQIAARCGFQDSGYFRRVFRRFEGLAPSRYRALYAQRHVITT